jgi:hypothetical protein
MQSKILFTVSLWRRGEKDYPVALGGGGGGFIHARVLGVLKLDGSLERWKLLTDVKNVGDFIIGTVTLKRRIEWLELPFDLIDSKQTGKCLLCQWIR